MIRENIRQIRSEIGKAQLIVVSKYRTLNELREVYESGEREFGENRVQALMERVSHLPDDINWHLIGHLQTNKVRQVLPVVSLIHSVDRIKLLNTIEKESNRIEKNTSLLLQIKVSDDESKFGFDPAELLEIVSRGELVNYPHITFRGVMSMTTLNASDDAKKQEFVRTKEIMDQIKNQMPAPEVFNICSMGMSDDYPLAIEAGSTHVRIGSRIFK